MVIFDLYKICIAWKQALSFLNQDESTPSTMDSFAISSCKITLVNVQESYLRLFPTPQKKFLKLKHSEGNQDVVMVHLIDSKELWMSIGSISGVF